MYTYKFFEGVVSERYSFLLLFLIWLLTYLFLLYIEIRSKIPKIPNQMKIGWRGFWFSFGAGIMFPILMSIGLRHSDKPFSLQEIPILLMGWTIGEAMFGIIGMAITAIIMHWILKLPDKT